MRSVSNRTGNEELTYLKAMMIKNAMSVNKESKRKREQDAPEEKDKIKVRVAHRPLYKKVKETQKEVEEADGQLKHMEITDN